MGSFVGDWLAILTGFLSAQPPVAAPIKLIVPLSDADDIPYGGGTATP